MNRLLEEALEIRKTIYSGNHPSIDKYKKYL
jgi:hypothetical protein